MRSLKHPETGKVWTARVDGDTFFSSTGGKERVTKLESPEAAADKLSKDVWKKLKAGFVLSADAVGESELDVGSASLLRYAGPGYGWIGRNPICARETDDAFFVASLLDDGWVVQQINADATATNVGSWGESGFVRSMAYADGQLLLNLEDQVVGLDLSDQEMFALTDEDAHASAVQIADGRATWHDGEAIVVVDLESGDQLFRREIEVRHEGGTSALAVAVSSTHLAYTNDLDTIQVVSLTDGSELSIQKVEPNRSEGMWLTADGSLYAFGMVPGDTRLHRYPLTTGATGERIYDPQQPSIHSVAMDHARTRFAVLYRHQALLEIIDAPSAEVHYRLTVDYMVNGGNCAFTMSGVALATYNGCIAHYRLTDELRSRTKKVIDADRPRITAQKGLAERFGIYPPLSGNELEEAEEIHGAELPQDYRALLDLANGLLPRSGGLKIYYARQAVARNRELAVPEGFFAVGDNGTPAEDGDVVVLLNLADRKIYEADVNDIRADSMRPSADSVDELIRLGSVLANRGEP